MSQGIYLVANKRSQELCANLIYSIRASACKLPIRIIHFGGDPIDSEYVLKETELQFFEDFPLEAQNFVNNLRSVLTDCPLGFLYRFLAWYSDWDEFIYSDNDIVALCNWEELFDLLGDNDLLHADTEYTTKGAFNYDEPEKVKQLFGKNALQTALTAGHILVRNKKHMITDINNAVTWFKENPSIPKKHDQSLIHIASLLGNWKIKNLCKPPHNWLSSWAGDFPNALDLIQRSQSGQRISHLHYSGGTPSGKAPIEELLLSNIDKNKRLQKNLSSSLKHLTYIHWLNSKLKKIKNRLSK